MSRLGCVVIPSLCSLQAARPAKKAKLERDAAEKKVDILQKALRHHPQSPEILLHLIQAAEVFQEDDEIQKRWQVCLRFLCLPEA